MKRGAVLLSTLPRKSDIHGDNIFSSVMEAFRPLEEKLIKEDGLELVMKHLGI